MQQRQYQYRSVGGNGAGAIQRERSNSSLTSTESVDGQLSIDKATASAIINMEETKEKKRKSDKGKLVRFDLASNRIHHNHQYCKEDIENLSLWYTRVELKAATSQDDDNCKQTTCDYLLQSVYLKCHDFLATESDIFQSDEFRELLHVNTDHMVGMESWILPTYEGDCERRQGDRSNYVVDLQERLCGNGEDITAPVEAMIRESCQGISHSSVLFARCLAIIQVGTVQTVPNNREAFENRIQQSLNDDRM